MAGNRSTISELLILLGVDPRDFEQGMRRAEGEARTFSQKVKKYFQDVADSMKSLGQKMTLAITAPLSLIGGSMIKMAMDAVESENLFEVSLGNMAKQARAWSNDLSKSLGLNQYEIRKNLGTLYVMMNSMGLNEQAAYGMSRGLTQLAYDMASFYNLKPEEAFEKLKDGIVGEADPLQELGILVGEETIKQYAYQNGIAATGKELTEQQKVLARYGAIMQQTSKAQGDLARTIDSPANKARIAKSKYEELSVTIGQKLLPVMDKLLTAANTALTWIDKLPGPIQTAGLVAVVAAWAFGPLLMAMASMTIIIPQAIRAFKEFTKLRYVAAVIDFVAAAFTRLNIAILRNPIVLGVTALALALLMVARSSKNVSGWLDQVIARLKALFGFNFEPPALTAEDPEAAAASYAEYAQALAGAGDAAGGAAKEMKKFLAAFDEVYQVPDDEGSGGPGTTLPTPPGGSGPGPGGGGGISDSSGLSLEWPPIPPFPGWPPIPPLPQIEPISLPQPLIIPEPMPVLQPVFEAIKTAWQSVVSFVMQPIPVPAWIYEFSIAWQQALNIISQPVPVPAWISELDAALNPIVLLATTFALAWQTATSLVSSAVTGLQTAWSTAMATMLAAAQPFISAGEFMSNAWKYSLDKIRQALEGFRDWASETWKRIGDSMTQPVSGAFSALKGFWENHKVEVLAIAGTLIIGLVGLFGGVPGRILTAIGPLLPQIGSFFGRIPGLFSNALSRLPGIASSIASRVSSILSNIGSTIGNVVNRASSYVRNLVSGRSATVPAYASGTSFHPGGWAIVGEEGPELVNLPRGSSVIPNTSISDIGGTGSGIVIDYDRLAAAIVSALQAAPPPRAILSLGNRELTDLERAMQPIRTREQLRRGGS